MNLTIATTICYAIPFLFPQFFLGLVLSYFLKVLGSDRLSNRINNSLANQWLRLFLFFTGRQIKTHLEGWEPKTHQRFLICNHTNSLEVPMFVALPHLSGDKNVTLSYLGTDIIQRYKLIPMMMHARIVEAVTYSERKPDFRSFKKDVLDVLSRRSIFLYPEGRRTYSEEIQTFQTGVLKIAYKFQIDLDVFVSGGLMGYATETRYRPLRKTKTLYFGFCGTIHAREHNSFESYAQKAESLMKEKKSLWDRQHYGT